MQHIGAIRVFFCLRGFTKFFSGWRDRKKCQVVVYCGGSVPKLILWNQDTFWKVMKRWANYFSKSYCWILCYVECIKESFKVDLTTIKHISNEKVANHLTNNFWQKTRSNRNINKVRWWKMTLSLTVRTTVRGSHHCNPPVCHMQNLNLDRIWILALWHDAAQLWTTNWITVCQSCPFSTTKLLNVLMTEFLPVWY